MQNDITPKTVSEWIAAHTGCSLGELCAKFGYPSRETKIMGLDETDERKSKIAIAKDKSLKELYVNSSHDPKVLAAKGGGMSFTQYFKTIVAQWLLDDLTVEMLREMGLEVSCSKECRIRDLGLSASVPIYNMMSITVGENLRSVAFLNEFNLSAQKKGLLEIVHSSFEWMTNKKVILVRRDIARGKYLLIDFASEKPKTECVGGIVRYVLSENGKRERDDRMLAAELITVIGCSPDKCGKSPEVESASAVEDAKPPVPEATTTAKQNKAYPKEQTDMSVAQVRPSKPEHPKAIEETPETSDAATVTEVGTDEVEETAMEDISYGDEDFV